MKLIEQKAELIPQLEGLEGVYKQIELAGRTAYHSLDKITLDSAKDFVDRMIKSKHGAALEHGTVYFNREVDHSDREYLDFEKFFDRNPYSKVDYEGGILYVVTNFRVIEENFNLKDFWKNNIQYLCSPTEFHEKRYTMRFITDRGVSHELVRHRVFSFIQESTRYCNYSKDKFGNEITFIKPSWLNCPFKDFPEDSELCYLTRQYPDEAAHRFIASLVESKYAYMTLLQRGYTPQEARQVLPNALKTEVCMTGFASDWRFFFDLRYYGETGKPHPDMELLASKARNEFIKAGLWDDIMKYPSKFDKNDTER